MASNALQTSVEIRTITDLLVATPIGMITTYEAMAQAVGFDVKSRKRYIIMAGIHHANKESGAVFASVRGVGYQRLQAEDFHTGGISARRKVRATTNRSANTIIRGVEKANDISPEAQRKAYGEVNSLAILRHLATDKTRAAVPETEKPLPVALTLAAMLRG